MIQWLRDAFSPEQRRVIGAEAQQLLDNKHLIDAFESVDHYINERALACDPTKPEQAVNVINCKQLLAAVRREIERKIADGDMARIEIEQLEQSRIPRMFRR